MHLYYFYQNFVEQSDPFNTSAAEWLDIVWALAVLDTIRPRHVKFVLDSTFVERLIGLYLLLNHVINLLPFEYINICYGFCTGSSKLNVSKKLKLLNINAIAQYVLKDYKGKHLKMCIY